MKFRYFIVFIIVVIGHLIAGVYFNGYSVWWIVLCVLIFLIVTVLGSIKIQWNFYMNSINKIPLSLQQLLQPQKRVALTFDDGPHENTIAVLDILKQENIAATFFVIGKNISGKESVLKRMNDEGHLIGNHSFEHGFNFDWQSSKKMILDLQQCNAAIEAVIDKPVTLFRPPYGVTNPNLAKAVQTLGFQSIGWNLRSMDTVAKEETTLLNKILDKTKVNSIILLHDRCDITVKILPQLIQELKNRNYVFVSPMG